MLWLLFFVAPPVLGINFSDGFGWVVTVGAVIGGYLFWYLMAFRAPRWTRCCSARVRAGAPPCDRGA